MAGVPHPMRGANKFKLGVFSANSDGGLTLTRVPERWPARWSEIVEVAQMADRAGIEFFLPIARWKGFEMARMHEAGFAGTTISFVNFKNELPYFIDSVLPLLRAAGLREE
jgi:alkanesulfonate monooxygenase SsuD/methylene tetrahydromethanopterin reductase-like flavin-dependent oxidoreductase (luciferase family)